MVFLSVNKKYIIITYSIYLDIRDFKYTISSITFINHLAIANDTALRR